MLSRQYGYLKQHVLQYKKREKNSKITVRFVLFFSRNRALNRINRYNRCCKIMTSTAESYQRVIIFDDYVFYLIKMKRVK